MFGNPQRYKAVLQQYEARHANAGCLLALLFVVPFLARSYSLATISCWTLIYVAVVVPLATGYITVGTLMALVKRWHIQKPIYRPLALKRLMVILHALASLYRWNIVTLAYLYFFQGVRCVLAVVVDENSLLRSTARHSRSFLHWLHSVYLHLENIQVTTNQVMFNMAAEKVLCPEERFASLYVLLFYTVLVYLQQSLKEYTVHFRELEVFGNELADFFSRT